VGTRNVAFHEGLLAGVVLGPLKLALTLGLLLLAVLLIAWCVDWVFVFKVWPDGIDRLRGLLADGLADGVALAARQGGGTGDITGPANGLYALVFEATGIHDMGLRFADASALSIPDTIVRRTYLEHREAIETAMVGTQLLGVRFATLLRFVPLLLLLYTRDPKILRWARVGEPLPPGQVPAAGGAGTGRDRANGLARRGGLGAMRGFDGVGNWCSCSAAVDVLQEAPVGLANVAGARTPNFGEPERAYFDAVRRHEGLMNWVRGRRRPPGRKRLTEGQGE